MPTLFIMEPLYGMWFGHTGPFSDALLASLCSLVYSLRRAPLPGNSRHFSFCVAVFHLYGVFRLNVCSDGSIPTQRTMAFVYPGGLTSINAVNHSVAGYIWLSNTTVG